MVTDIRPGSLASSPADILVGTKRAFFRARNGTGIDLWTTDRTVAGTLRIYDQDNEAGSSSGVVIYNGRFYFGGQAGQFQNSIFGQ